MGKLFGSIAFFLIAVILVYLLNFTAIDMFVTSYIISGDTFEAMHLVASFELLHHPLEYIWVIPSWLVAGFIGGLISRSWKSGLFLSLITGLILSLTWIFFMSRYLPNYWNEFLLTHPTLEFLGNTLAVGLLLGLISAGTCICGALITSPEKKDLTRSPIKEIDITCPNCGTHFQSSPKFCYKCNTLLKPTEISEN